MPIYEYQCQQCGHQLEALQKISDPALTECPQCQQQALQKLVSAASFRLKGGGWYETDFKSGNKKHLADSAESSGSNGAAGSGEGSEGGDSGSSSKDAAKDAKDSSKTEKSAKAESKGTAGEKKAKPAASNTDSKKSAGSSK